jgi:hypothetical protein
LPDQETLNPNRQRPGNDSTNKSDSFITKWNEEEQGGRAKDGLDLSWQAVDMYYPLSSTESSIQI